MFNDVVAQQKKIVRLQGKCEHQHVENQTDKCALETAKTFLAANEVLSKETPGKTDADTADIKDMAAFHKAQENEQFAQVWKDIVKNSESICRTGKRNGNRFTVASIKYALSLLNKIGTSAYTQIAKDFNLPTRRHLGQWRSAASHVHGPIHANMQIARKEMTERGAWTEENRVLALSFDAMTISQVCTEG